MRLVCAHCMEANEEWLGRRYLWMDIDWIEEAIAEMRGDRAAAKRAGRSTRRCEITPLSGPDESFCRAAPCGF